MECYGHRNSVLLSNKWIQLANRLRSEAFCICRGEILKREKNEQHLGGPKVIEASSRLHESPSTASHNHTYGFAETRPRLCSTIQNHQNE